jgi:Uma2 family endonuclease
MATHAFPKLTEDEYLRLERAAEFKSEFVAGEVFAMSGGSPRHSELAANFIAALHAKLQGRCRIYTSDLRVRTKLTGAYVYPDISVVCGKPELHADSDDILINPRLIVEVLSPASASYDRGNKFDLYREIPSLSDYVLCHQDCARLEIFTRQADASWIYRDVPGLTSTINLTSLACEIPLCDIYSGIEF